MDLYWIGMLVFVGSVLIVVIWAIRQYVHQDKTFQNQQDTILQNGVCVPGHIITYREDFTSPRGIGYHTYNHHVTFSYEYEGKTYTHEQEVSKEIYLASPEETQVSVHFPPDDPINVVTNFEVGSS